MTNMCPSVVQLFGRQARQNGDITGPSVPSWISMGKKYERQEM